MKISSLVISLTQQPNGFLDHANILQRDSFFLLFLICCCFFNYQQIGAKSSLIFDCIVSRSLTAKVFCLSLILQGSVPRFNWPIVVQDLIYQHFLATGFSWMVFFFRSLSDKKQSKFSLTCLAISPAMPYWNFSSIMILNLRLAGVLDLDPLEEDELEELDKV